MPVAAVLAGALLIAAAPQATANSRAFTTYPTCNVYEPKPRVSNRCMIGTGFGGVLVSKRRAHVHYRFCWRRPGGKHKCVRKRVRHRNRASTLALTGGERVGTYRLTWKHAGHVIDRDKLHVTIGD